MPWKAEQRGSKWVVVKLGTNEIVGTHTSEQDALAQVKALYANTKGYSARIGFEPFAKIGNGEPIRLMPVGKWYRGDRELDITKQLLQEVVTNFEAGLPQHKVGIDLDHAEYGGKVGNVSALAVLEGEAAPKGDGLYITDYDLTDKGVKAVTEEGYDAVSAEIVWKLNDGALFQDPKTGTEHDNVLVGVALTPRPFFGTEVAIFSATKETMADVTKSENDGAHPMDHYLVHEDPSSPTTWHLRFMDKSGKIDTGLLGGAWAALHEGYRGNKYEGPDKAAALKRLMAAYHEAGMQAPSERNSTSHKEETMADQELTEKLAVETAKTEKLVTEKLALEGEKKTLEEKLTALEATQAAEKLAQRKAALEAEAKSYKNLSVEVPVYVEKFAALEVADSVLADWVRAQFAAHDTAAGAVTEEKGVDLEGIEDPSAKFTAAVDSIQKAEKLSYEAAVTAAIRKYPELADAYAMRGAPAPAAG